jgi:phosphatidylserine decarboxylase
MFIRKEGLPHIAIATLIALAFIKTPLNVIIWLIPLFVVWFFRDPERVVPQGNDLIICPADGKVIQVVEMNEELVGPCTKVAIFMSVFNVHVNRALIYGTVLKKIYKPGKFHVASVMKKTEANERMIHYIKNEKGVFRMDQVAGLVARRIISWPEVSDTLGSGQKIGLICFGSLVECYIPKGANILVAEGQKTSAGVTILGRL